MTLVPVKIENDVDVDQKKENDIVRSKKGEENGSSMLDELSVLPKTTIACCSDSNAVRSLPRTAGPNTLELLPHQAERALFPPGCCVLHADTTQSPPIVTIGTVKSVAIKLGQSNELLYCIKPKSCSSTDTSEFYVKQSQLQWGPTCPVWARPMHFFAQEPNLPAIVLESCQTNEKVMYSVQDANDPETMYHGIPHERILGYRQTENLDNALPSNVERGLQVDLAEPDSKSLQTRSSEQRQMLPSPVSTTEPLDRTHTDTSKMHHSFAQARSTPPITRALSNGSIPVAKKLRLSGDRTKEELEASHILVALNSPLMAPRNTRTTRKTYEINEKIIKGPTTKTGEQESIPTGVKSKGSEIATRRLSIPSMIGVDSLRAALIGERGEINEELERFTGCKFYLKGYNYQQGSTEGKGFYIEIEGLERILDNAVEAIENAIVSVFPKGERIRLLYHLAKANKTDKTFDGVAVLQRCSISAKDKLWMTVYAIPRQNIASMGLFVGRNGAGLKEIMAETGCKIYSVKESPRPYLVVAGESACHVSAAVPLIKKRLTWARHEHAKGRKPETESPEKICSSSSFELTMKPKKTPA